MVLACERWFSLRAAVLSSLFIGSVALAAVLVSQDAGKRDLLSTEYLSHENFNFEIKKGGACPYSLRSSEALKIPHFRII